MSTDPITLAREVLDAVHEDETITVCTIPDNKAAALARAVLAAEALAGQLRETANESYQEGLDDVGDAYQAAANLIRAALNEETPR